MLKKQEKKEIGQRMMDLALARIFKRTYQGLDSEQKLDWERTFNPKDNQKKQALIDRYVPDFDSIYAQELNDVVKELEEIEKGMDKK